jgi:hypothetical protein
VRACIIGDFAERVISKPEMECGGIRKPFIQCIVVFVSRDEEGREEGREEREREREAFPTL